MEFLTDSSLVFGYRDLKIPGMYDPRHPPVVIEGSFGLQPGKKAALTAEAADLLKRRSNQQPKGLASAGCFFKNPEDADPAGALIEKAGMKGVKINDAMVSETHANFILNRGKAQAADILRLMERVQKAVYEQFRIKLEPEVRIVGE